MPQVLKEETREKIRAAALQEFLNKGYFSAAMRAIAEHAGIPTGLVYSYYENKDALFEAVVSPVLPDWERIWIAGHDGPSREIYGFSQAEAECLIRLFHHRQECIVLLDKSEGTKFEGEKARLIRQIELRLKRYPQSRSEDEVFLHILASGFTDSLIQVMRHYKGKVWAITTLHRLSERYFPQAVP